MSRGPNHTVRDLTETASPHRDEVIASWVKDVLRLRPIDHEGLVELVARTFHLSYFTRASRGVARPRHPWEDAIPMNARRAAVDRDQRLFTDAAGPNFVPLSTRARGGRPR